MQQNDSLVLNALENNVLAITLNRPEKKNALTIAMYSALADALSQAQSDPEVRAVLLSGRECFTSGNDISDFLNNPRTNEDSENQPVLRFLTTLASFEKPIVAAVNGPAVGIGTTLLLHCDLVYAASDTMFQLPFVNLGLCPEAASSLLLPQLVGYRHAAELLLLGEPFAAQQALDIGLLTAICDAAELHDLARTKAQALAAKPAAALRLSKALLKQDQAEAVKTRIMHEAGHFRERLQSPETKEALQAFMERRPPDFSRFA